MLPFRLLNLLWILPILGCQSLSFYGQAIRGQWQFVTEKQKVSSIIDQKGTPERLKQALQLSQSIRQFAETELQLPSQGSYRHYLDLQRPYPVWAVVATPAYAFEPYLWCYPWLGCLSYRGYFNSQSAIAEAQRLEHQGWDVALAPVSAYSTLGWFEDPLLNSFIFLPPERLAGLIFHELAHQKLYIADDTAFNEAFASTVEQLGVERWLKAQRPERLPAYHQSLQREARIQQVLNQYRQRLQHLYQSPYANKLAAKRQILRELSQALQQLKTDYWPQDSSKDNWLSQPKNNAHLLHQATYRHWLPAFRHLWQQQPDIGAFYRQARQLAQLPAPQRQRQLERLRSASGADADVPVQ